MGQSLPLPERIPKPDEKTFAKMKDKNITVDMESNDLYVSYTLPLGWKMVDNSWRQDLPEYHIVDDNNLVHFSIFGAWKETYDNKLSIRAVENPHKLVPQEEKVIPGETNDVAIISKILH